MTSPISFSELKAFFDQSFLASMKKASIPGAVAVIVQGDEAHVTPYGVKSIESDPQHHDHDRPVTEHTLFAMASISKQFAGMSLCLMQKDGHIHLNDPIQRHLPDVPIGPSDLWAKITVADLLTHGTGLNEATMEERHSLLMQGEDAIKKALKHAQPDAPYHTRYSYFNPTYYLIPSLIQKYYNMDWVSFLTSRMLHPMSCIETNAEFHVVHGDQVSRNYMGVRGTDGTVAHVPVEHSFQKRLNMAGGLFSSGHDLARILKLHLQKGAPIFSPEDLSPLYHPYMSIDPVPDFTVAKIAYRRYGLAHYGLGLKVGHVTSSDGDTSPIYLHEGSIQGARGIFTVLPKWNIGMCILTNMGGHDAASYVVFDTLDQMLGLPPRDSKHG